MAAPRKTGKGTADSTFTAEEREAMRAYAAEKKAARGKADNEDGEQDLLAKIAEMNDTDRAVAESIHAIVKKTAPELISKTWYGMPAYATKAGKVVCFFQPSQKFKTRYSTFGFSDQAKLDEGNVWPNSYAVTKVTAADEARIAELVKRAVG
jgi:uncharacterized protein YdhG (YjbR/CyaY superfamily)